MIWKQGRDEETPLYLSIDLPTDLEFEDERVYFGDAPVYMFGIFFEKYISLFHGLSQNEVFCPSEKNDIELLFESLSNHTKLYYIPKSKNGKPSHKLQGRLIVLLVFSRIVTLYESTIEQIKGMLNEMPLGTSVAGLDAVLGVHSGSEYMVSISASIGHYCYDKGNAENT